MTKFFLQELDIELENLAKKLWFPKEEQKEKENAFIIIKLVLFKWLRSSTKFESLPKFANLLNLQFKNKLENEEFRKLHQEINQLFPKEEQIILAYLCQGKIAFKFTEIREILGQDPRNGMPKEYLINCLERIAQTLEKKAIEYRTLLEPFVTLLQVKMKVEEQDEIDLLSSLRCCSCF